MPLPQSLTHVNDGSNPRVVMVEIRAVVVGAITAPEMPDPSIDPEDPEDPEDSNVHTLFTS